MNKHVSKKSDVATPPLPLVVVLKSSLVFLLQISWNSIESSLKILKISFSKFSFPHAERGQCGQGEAGQLQLVPYKNIAAINDELQPCDSSRPFLPI